MTAAENVRAQLPLAPPTPAARVGAPRWEHRYVVGLLTIDLLATLIASVAGFIIRFREVSAFNYGYASLSLAFPLLWVAALYLARAYETRFLFVGTDEYHRVMMTGVALVALISFVAYASHIEVARGYVLAVLPLATVTDLVARYAWRKQLHRMRVDGRCMRRVLVVGYERSVANLCRQFRRERYHGMEVVGACLPPHRPSRARIEDVGVDVLGTFHDVAEAAIMAQADTVAVLACPELDAEALRRLAWQLEPTRTSLLVAPALLDVAGPRTTIRPVDGLPLLHVEHAELSGVRRAVKTVFDTVVAAIALVFLSPLMLAIAAAVRLSDRGPALFCQVRIGRDGRPFKLYKFRTMQVDAEERLAELLALNEHQGVMFKIRRDPRITRVGAWLRKYSLDELPQLLNVLLGNMSLVGPRPPLPREVEMYPDYVRRRLVVKPGITGLWQVSGRADLSWEEAVRLDLRYVENWSLAVDIMILIRTVSAVARSAGAY
jgi:exopolysaccharide biosynthesis polyprenyl glycosylphosphotransferase